MKKCRCQDNLGKLVTSDDVIKRAEQRDRLKATLTELTIGNWQYLYRCQVCGQYWQSSHYEERLAAQYEVLCPVPPIDPEEWKAHPYPDDIHNAVTRSRIITVEKALGREIGPEQCREENCSRLCVAHSVYCRQHHIESLQRIGALPELSDANYPHTKE